MTGREVRPLPVHGTDGAALLQALRAGLSGDGPAVLPHAATQPPSSAHTRALDAHEDDPHDPTAAVVRTTGSTGAAKAVLLPASALLASAAATHDHLGGAGRWVLAVPAWTVAGVQVLVRSLVAGTRPVPVDSREGFSAAAFARAVEHLTGPGRRYCSLVPAQVRRLTDDPAGRDALSGLDAVLVGGAALPDDVRAAAEATGTRVVATYGMTETCGGCVYDGVPLPGVGVDLEPVDGLAAEGRVVLAGPVVARGYRDGPARDGAHVTTAVDGFVAAGDGRRGFRTADRGRWADGRLQVLGRLDDVVQCGGVNVALDAVTRTVQRLPGVRDALAVGVPDRAFGTVVGVLVVPAGPTGSTGDPADLRRAVVEAVRTDHGRAATPHHLAVVDAVPQQGVGKPDRGAALALLTAMGHHGGQRPERSRPNHPSPRPDETPEEQQP